MPQHQHLLVTDPRSSRHHRLEGRIQPPPAALGPGPRSPRQATLPPVPTNNRLSLAMDQLPGSGHPRAPRRQRIRRRRPSIYYLGINNLQVSADPVTCRTRLNGKQTQRLVVLGKAGRFLAIPDHFGPINDNWSEPRIPGQAATASSPVSGSSNEACRGYQPSRGRTVRTRVMKTPNASMKSRRNCSVDLSVTSPSSVISPAVNWM